MRKRRGGAGVRAELNDTPDGMKQRVVDIDCDAASARELAGALRAYADAAYPPGGSECAQVARGTLLDTAAACERHSGGVLPLRRRQMPILRTAVRWWLSERADLCVESARDLEQLLVTPQQST